VLTTTRPAFARAIGVVGGCSSALLVAFDESRLRLACGKDAPPQLCAVLQPDDVGIEKAPGLLELGEGVGGGLLAPGWRGRLDG
jgi:hypothetical protein